MISYVPAVTRVIWVFMVTWHWLVQIFLWTLIWVLNFISTDKVDGRMFHASCWWAEPIMCLFPQQHPQYTLVVRAADMLGEGLSGQANVILKVTMTSLLWPITEWTETGLTCLLQSVWTCSQITQCMLMKVSNYVQMFPSFVRVLYIILYLIYNTILWSVQSERSSLRFRM